jgi:hypothetical protein
MPPNGDLSNEALDVTVHDGWVTLKEVEVSATGLQPGDFAIEEAVQRELREDASTTDLSMPAAPEQRSEASTGGSKPRRPSLMTRGQSDGRKEL